MKKEIEKMAALFEDDLKNNRIDDFVCKVDALKKMEFYDELIDGLIVTCLSLQIDNKILNGSLTAAENVILSKSVEKRNHHGRK